MKLIVPDGTGIIVPGTIACIGLCDGDIPHRHNLTETYGLPVHMRESPTFQAIVVSLARHYGLEVLTIPDSRRVQMRGWPDLTIKGKRTIIWRELKSAHGILQPDQRKVGSLLADWAVWRPADLWSGHIEAKLKEISG